LSQKEDISRGKFSFVTENYDTFEICFVSRVPPRKYRTYCVNKVALPEWIEKYGGASVHKLNPFLEAVREPKCS
jgi:hypothetical protein